MFKNWKIIDIVIAIVFVLTNISFLLLPSLVFKFFLWTLIILVFSRLLILLKKKLFWKIRNRLLFSGLFFIATPIFFISIFFFFAVNILLAQYGLTILENVFNSQLTQLEGLIDSQLRQKNPLELSRALETVIKLNNEQLNVLLFKKEGDEYRSYLKFPSNFDDSRLPTTEFRGFFLLNEQLYHGVLRRQNGYAMLAAMTINQLLLDGMSTISDFKIKYRHPLSGTDKLKDEITSNPSIMDEKTLFFPYLFEYKFLDLDTLEDGKPVERINTFLLILDYSRIYNKLRTPSTGSVQTTTKKILYFLVVLFGTFIVISFFIGFRMIRVITRSINQITKGTQKIRNGDFSVRIKTRAGDQLHYLAESFNEMAAGIDRLLREEKERHRLEEELRIARSIQLKLLPADVFETEDFEIAAVNIPAAEIAGDYFDYHHQEGNLSLLVADVSGKGASAAFYMAEMKGLINYLIKGEMSPASLICECHESLITSFDKITFITMSIAKFDIPGKKFLFSRAGHTPAIFFDAHENECRELFPEGVAIGLLNFSREKIKEIELPFHPGDILLLFSDGLSEILNKNDEMIGVENLKDIIYQHKNLSARAIKQKILDFSIRFSDDDIKGDDLTFIVLKVK